VQYIAENLRVDEARMLGNIAATGGTVFAERAMMLLAQSAGRDTAHLLVGRAAAEVVEHGVAFREALASIDGIARVLSPAELETIDAPEQYLGVAEQLRVRLLATD
jgi:adenylosuccinate lyase